MIRRPAALLLALIALVPFGCLEESRAQHELTAEEQVLMARLTRDPGVIIESWSRNGDQYVEVITTQGAMKERYVFKPDRPGERALNVHHIDDTSRLDSKVPDYAGNGPIPDRTGRYR
jgi:hypothetical protein